MDLENEDPVSKSTSQEVENRPVSGTPESTATFQQTNAALPVITDDIAHLSLRVDNGHFWPYYRKLKSRPPLYDCHGHLANQMVPHGVADEEDPSLNAKFDPSRFVYPVQKNVQQAPRNTNGNVRPPKQSTLPSVTSLAVRKSGVNATEPKPERVLGGNRNSSFKNEQTKDPIPASGRDDTKLSENLVRPASIQKDTKPIVQSTTATQPTSGEPDTQTEAPSKTDQPIVFRASMLNQSADSLAEKSRKRKAKLSVGERVRQMQHHGVPISQDRVRQLVRMAKKNERILEYATKIDRRNKILAVVIQKKQELREKKNQESVANAKEICKKAANDQLRMIKRFPKHTEELKTRVGRWEKEVEQLR